MTYSIIAFIWRKPSITPEEFKRHYETVHMPLVLSSFGPYCAQSHTRYYIPRPSRAGDGTSGASGSDHPIAASLNKSEGLDFDAIAYLIWEDENSFKRALEKRRDPEIAARIAADEENFLLREKMVMAPASEPFVTLRPKL